MDDRTTVSSFISRCVNARSGFFHGIIRIRVGKDESSRRLRRPMDEGPLVDDREDFRDRDILLSFEPVMTIALPDRPDALGGEAHRCAFWSNTLSAAITVSSWCARRSRSTVRSRTNSVPFAVVRRFLTCLCAAATKVTIPLA